jgi:hypothetical protein
MLTTVLLLLSLGPAAPDTVRSPAAGPVPQDAYHDAGARELVRLARERQTLDDRSIVEYRMLASQRISVGMRALRRDRMLFRRELAARIHWKREGVGRIEVLGAREAVPVATRGVKVLDRSDLRSDPADLAFDPSREWLLRTSSTSNDIRHPLATGSERDYRFQTGDTTHLRLADGTRVRLIELRVLPRRTDHRLVRGSLWLEAETHAAVRGVFQLSGPMVVDAGDDFPRMLAVAQPIRADLRYLTVEYGLWEGRWWLPRLLALEATAQLGSALTVPVLFEQRYADYEVSAAGGLPERPRAGEGPGSPALAVLDTVSVSAGGRETRRCEDGSCFRYEVAVPSDSVLLHSAELPVSIHAAGEALISERELRELGELFGRTSSLSGLGQRPRVRWGYLEPGLMRYNRVEGLALGGRLDVEYGALATGARLWVGTADPTPLAELFVERSRFAARQRVAAYHRLDAVAPDARALGLGSSLSALVLGRDDSDYYRSLGVEVGGRPVGLRALDYEWRLFAERQGAVAKGTDFSLGRLLTATDTFPANIAAAAADQLGAALTLRYTGGLDPAGFRWGAEAATTASTGSFDFVRPSLSLWSGFPLPGPLAAALEVAGGTALGEAPVQSWWYLGGPATVRGYGGGSRVAGESFWRARAELGTDFPAARLVLFSDAGWAGERTATPSGPTLLSAGVGGSLLDGLIRADLARALRGHAGWRFDLYLDALF